MKVTHGASFQKELKKLKKKYRSLDADLDVLEKLIESFPYGEDARHCTALKRDGDKCLCKRRMICRSLKSTEFRVVYFYDGTELELVYLELYFKGDKEIRR
ncbi:hypothetical protein OAB00_00905 [Akkermansiaceae bacterium]|nr:hypothetical protein [Akkermansiaceae bacterium]